MMTRETGDFGAVGSFIASTKQAFHLAAQVGQPDWFRNVSREAGGKRLLAVPIHGAGGERHDRSGCKTDLASKFLNHTEAIERRHLKVQQDELGSAFHGLLERLRAVRGFNHLVAAVLE